MMINYPICFDIIACRPSTIDNRSLLSNCGTFCRWASRRHRQRVKTHFFSLSFSESPVVQRLCHFGHYSRSLLFLPLTLALRAVLLRGIGRLHRGCGQRVSDGVLYLGDGRSDPLVWLQRLHAWAVRHCCQRQGVLHLRLQSRFPLWWLDDTVIISQLVIIIVNWKQPITTGEPWDCTFLFQHLQYRVVTNSTKNRYLDKYGESWGKVFSCWEIFVHVVCIFPNNY